MEIMSAESQNSENLQILNLKVKTSQTNVTVIENDVTIEGDITLDGIAHIIGNINGNIHSENGQVEIFKGGTVTGNIICNILTVNGHVTGDCFCEKINILESGKVLGRISYYSLTVKEGGILGGQLNPQTKKITTRYITNKKKHITMQKRIKQSQREKLN